MSPPYAIQYFPIKARAELIRLVLEAAGVPYENKAPNWPADKEVAPFGQLPLLHFKDDAGHDTVLAQSMAIVRYLSKKHGLVPKDEIQAAIVDSVTESIAETAAALTNIMFRLSDADKPAAKEKLATETIPAFIKAHTQLLEKNGNNGHYSGNSITYADLALFNLIFAIHGLIPDAFTETTAPALVKVYKTVEEHPNIKAYLASPRRFK
ncbi:glutathione S-transferase [Blastocladiella britannica]|nr:glutathione S-transferase [Blastocladiella britannica]